MKHHKYGAKSRSKLNTCHPDIQAVAIRALELSPYDITVIHGHRGEAIQNALFDSGASKLQWPESRHNASDDESLDDPENWSDAIDFAPWIDNGIPWKDTHAFAVVAGCFFAAANELGVTLRWGGDWDMDGSTTDQTFMDWGHMEIMH